MSFSPPLEEYILSYWLRVFKTRIDQYQGVGISKVLLVDKKSYNNTNTKTNMYGYCKVQDFRHLWGQSLKSWPALLAV